MEMDKKDKKRKVKFKVGDKIVKFGQIFRIFRVTKRKLENGEKEKVIHFKAYFKNSHNKNLKCSIPVKNISLASIRKPITKKGLKELLNILSNKIKLKKPINTTIIRETLNENDPIKTAKNLKRIWIDKKNDSTTFTKSKSDIYKKSIKRLEEEVALVSNTPLPKARKMIKKALKKTR